MSVILRWLLIFIASINLVWFLYLRVKKNRTFRPNEVAIAHIIFVIQILGFGLCMYLFNGFYMFSIAYVILFFAGFLILCKK